MHVHARVRSCNCICKDHRPPHQMIHNHLTPINSGAVVVLFNSPLTAWQLLLSPLTLNYAVSCYTAQPPHSVSCALQQMLYHVTYLLNYSCALSGSPPHFRCG